MANRTFYNDDARRRVLEGAKMLYEAVAQTFGPRSRNVVIAKGGQPPTVSHDGVFVARAIDLDESDDETLGYKVGAELIKQAAGKMDNVGDGSTTSTVLTYHILNEANKLIAAGHNPMLLRKGLEAAATTVIAGIGELAEDIKGNKDRIAQIATISAGDSEIGTMIADVMDKIGEKGTVTVEEGQGLKMESEVVEGYSFGRGFVSPYMATDTTRMEAVLDSPLVLVTDMKVTAVADLLPLLESLVKSGKKNLAVIADDVQGDALGAFILNKLKGVLNTVAIKAPTFGDRRTATLQDIAILTGATFISEEQGYTLNSVTIDMLGKARKVIVTKDNTTIVEGHGKQEDVAARLEEIKAQAEQAGTEYDKEFHDKRYASLNQKVAIIKVGGATETEIEEKKFRVDDAVAAAKAAVADGIVPGGGVTLVNIASQLSSDASDPSVDAGWMILRNALLQPFRVLLSNSGLNPDEWLPLVRKATIGHGVDVNNPVDLIDLKNAGIIDPAKVTKQAVLNAVSVAGTAMTMGALIVEIPDKRAMPDMSQAAMM